MNRRTEITKKSSSSGSATHSTKTTVTTTTVTNWKSEVRLGSSSSLGSSQFTTNKVIHPSSSSAGSFSSFPKKSIVSGNGFRSTDATALYKPVYPRNTTTASTSILGPATAKSLFYSFPKSPPEVKYAPTSKPQQPPLIRTPVITTNTPIRTASPLKPVAAQASPISKTVPSDHIYSQSYSKSKRLVYIMNHYQYNKSYQMKREGSLEDVKSLTKTLTKFNCTIKERHDQTKAEILDMARKQAMKNYKGFDFIIYIIMTHGGTDKHLAARDQMYNLEREFIQEMQTNRTWAGVPKVFIIQACRGDLETDATPVRSPPFAPNDTLKMFATYEGYVSYRTSQGTFFIQDLCNKINEFGNSEELMSIMRRVTLEISKKAPTPEQSSTLQKALYLGKIDK